MLEAKNLLKYSTMSIQEIAYYLNFSKEMVCLEEEVEYLKSYVMIQNERFGGKVQLKLELEPDTRKCLIPKLILQPLAENSFEHGLLNKAGDWLLTVESHTTPEGDLLICIKDNGIGFDSERLAQISALNDLARQRGQTLAEMALAWLLHHDEVTTVLIGASKTQQILDNIKAVEHTTFTPDELAVIDRISK